MKSSRATGLIFAVGFLLVFAALITGLSALKYQFGLDYESKGHVDDSDIREWRSYADLTSDSQRAVDRAIEGESILFESRGSLPGYGSDGKLGVTKGGDDYVFYRRIVFTWWKPEGILSMLFGLTGIACIGLAIRWE